MLDISARSRAATTDKGKIVNYASPMDGVIIYQFQKNKNKQPLHLKVPAIGLNKENSFFTMECWGAADRIIRHGTGYVHAFSAGLAAFRHPRINKEKKC